MCIRDVLKKHFSIDELRNILSVQNKTYLIVGELPSNKVYLQFEGRLNGNAVVWNACICTINHYAQRYVVDTDPKQFIDIKIEDEIFWLKIALNIKQIDKAAIERTIIMIRKYKRLQIGRHEYGVRSKMQ